MSQPLQINPLGRELPFARKITERVSLLALLVSAVAIMAIGLVFVSTPPGSPIFSPLFWSPVVVGNISLFSFVVFSCLRYKLYLLTKQSALKNVFSPEVPKNDPPPEDSHSNFNDDNAITVISSDSKLVSVPSSPSSKKLNNKAPEKSAEKNKKPNTKKPQAVDLIAISIAENQNPSSNSSLEKSSNKESEKLISAENVSNKSQTSSSSHEEQSPSPDTSPEINIENHFLPLSKENIDTSGEKSRLEKLISEKNVSQESPKISSPKEVQLVVRGHQAGVKLCIASLKSTSRLGLSSKMVILSPFYDLLQLVLDTNQKNMTIVNLAVPFSPRHMDTPRKEPNKNLAENDFLDSMQQNTITIGNNHQIVPFNSNPNSTFVFVLPMETDSSLNVDVSEKSHKSSSSSEEEFHLENTQKRPKREAILWRKGTQPKQRNSLLSSPWNNPASEAKGKRSNSCPLPKQTLTNLDPKRVQSIIPSIENSKPKSNSPRDDDADSSSSVKKTPRETEEHVFEVVDFSKVDVNIGISSRDEQELLIKVREQLENQQNTASFLTNTPEIVTPQVHIVKPDTPVNSLDRVEKSLTSSSKERKISMANKPSSQFISESTKEGWRRQSTRLEPNWDQQTLPYSNPDNYPLTDIEYMG